MLGVKSVYEEVASLYLRLNGFLQHTDYVIEETPRGFEIDIIAYRPPGAKEVIRIDDREYPLSPDEELFRILSRECNEGDIHNIGIAALVSVKGRGSKAWNGDYHNIYEKIRYAHRLLGIEPDEERNSKLIDCFRYKPCYYYCNAHGRRSLIVALLGFEHNRGNNSERIDVKEGTGVKYILIPIRRAVSFIVRRVCEVESNSRSTQDTRGVKGRNIIHYPSKLFSFTILLSELYRGRLCS